MNKTELLLQDDRCLQNYNICSHVIKNINALEAAETSPHIFAFV